MANVPNSSLPFNDNASNGNVITQVEWNQFMQVLQQAINDNYQTLLRSVKVLNSDGSTSATETLPSVSGQQNTLQFEMSPTITITPTNDGKGNVTLQFSIPDGGITQAQLNNSLVPTTMMPILAAAPSTGTWNAGQFVFNANPIPGGNVGWVCTTGGTPGTWYAFGLISLT